MPFVTIDNVSKTFGATKALQSVSLEIEAGEVHGLLGENGAGKSTLMKVLSGIVSPDEGKISIGGRHLKLGSPQASRESGLAMAYQELSSPENLAVEVKLSLPDLPRGRAGLVSKTRVRQAAVERLARWEIDDIDPSSLVGDLSFAQRQHIELVSALSMEPKLLILDEPTAALPDPEWLFRQVRKLTATGASVIYITHKLTEIREVCDRGTVLRNGRVVGSFATEEMDEPNLIQLMVGRSLTQAFPPKGSTSTESPALVVRGAEIWPKLNGVDITVGRGEIVGMAGLEGQGQRELFYALAGAARLDTGTVEIRHEKISHDDPSSGDRLDVVLVPEERNTEGLFMQMTSRFNFTISHLAGLSRGVHVNRRKERAFAEASAQEVNLPRQMLSQPISALSGGNQQKVVFGRALLSHPRCLLLFDPTRGVDVATKVEIYHMTRRYAEAGGSVLIYSTEIPELVGLCDRVYSIYGGKIHGEHSDEGLSEEAVMRAALGRHDGRVSS